MLLRIFLCISLAFFISSACSPDWPKPKDPNVFDSAYLPVHVGISVPQLIILGAEKYATLPQYKYLRSWPINKKQYCPSQALKEKLTISFVLSNGQKYPLNQKIDAECRNNFPYAALYLSEKKDKLYIILANLHMLSIAMDPNMDTASIHIQNQNELFQSPPFSIIKKIDIQEIKDFTQISKTELNNIDSTASQLRLLNTVEVKLNNPLPAIWRYMYVTKEAADYTYLDPIFQKAKKMKDKYSFPLVKIILSQKDQEVPFITANYVTQTKTLNLQYLYQKNWNRWDASPLKIKFMHYDSGRQDYLSSAHASLNLKVFPPSPPNISVVSPVFKSISTGLPFTDDVLSPYQIYIEHKGGADFDSVQLYKYDQVYQNNTIWFTLSKNRKSINLFIRNIPQLAAGLGPSPQAIYTLHVLYKDGKKYISHPFAIRNYGLAKTIIRYQAIIPSEGMQRFQELFFYNKNKTRLTDANGNNIKFQINNLYQQNLKGDLSLQVNRTILYNEYLLKIDSMYYPIVYLPD